MKSIGRPGGRVGRLVMHEMHDLEKSGVMHEPMRPIEIGIVYEKQQGEDRNKIKPTHLIDLLVPQGILRDIRIAYEDKGHQRKNGDRDGGVADLPQVIIPFRKSFLDLSISKRFTKQYIEDQKGKAGDKHIPAPNQLQDLRVLIQDNSFE